MKKLEKGLGKKLTNYGDKEFSKYLRRSFAKSMGYSNKSLNKPIVGICYTESGFNNCHRNFPEMLEAVKRGILSSGALPVPFPVISLGETFLSPTSMVYRNLMAMCVEEMINAQPMDSVILMGGCDKTVPALLMGAFSANIPSSLLVPGPMMTGLYKGERIGACTDCRRFWNKYRSKEIDRNEIDLVEEKLAITSGTCSVMGTASTMAIISEILGIMIPNSACIPSVHADRLRVSEETGVIASKMAIENSPKPRDFITEKSIENTLRVLLSISGSTNAIIHLTAIAGRLGISIDLKELNRLSDETPVLINLKPTGSGYMEDLYNAGGVTRIIYELRKQLHLDCTDITGKTLEQKLVNSQKENFDQSIIYSFSDPVNKKGGLISLFGSLAPEGAILKRAAATKSLLEHQGRAVVFSSLEDLANRVDEPNLDVKESDILILQNSGPSSNSGMPEAGYLPIPKKLLAKGVKDMIRISDARMSGTAFGTIILHVTPESNKKGPLAIVRNGDIIKLSEKNKSLDILISKEELLSRISKLTNQKNIYNRGYKKLYQDSVLPATQGCDFDFLK